MGVISRIVEIIEYRDMIHSMVKRELRGRYQRSVLGMLWTLLGPLFQIAIYTMVFTVIFPRSIPNYHVYLTAGIIPWTFFNEAVGQGTGSIIANAEMTKKIYFPREVLPVSSVTAKFVNLLLAFLIVFAFVIGSGIGIDVRVIWLLPVIMVGEYLTALGFALLFSAVTVYFRDMEHIVGILMMAWIWATPIMYTTDDLTDGLLRLLKINPMTNIIICYHDILYYHRMPQGVTIATIYAIGLLLVVCGELAFSRMAPDFAEEL